jgi:hypothetical protein
MPYMKRASDLKAQARQKAGSNPLFLLLFYRAERTVLFSPCGRLGTSESLVKAPEKGLVTDKTRERKELRFF